MEIDKIYLGDCLELMKEIPDKSIDCIICDLPYGTTACKWDVIIPFKELWEQYTRITKDNGAIILFSKQPFTSDLINSNRDMFRYELRWEKTRAGNSMQVKNQPSAIHENIEVFYKNQPTYNPQMEVGEPYVDKRQSGKRNASVGTNDGIARQPINNIGTRYPSSVQKFSNGNNGNVHPTQKPVELLEYLIKTYTNENEVVLDNCMGSGSTGVACKNLNRNFIGIELDEKYFNIAKQRITGSQK